jgi:hypothetical protein
MKRLPARLKTRTDPVRLTPETRITKRSAGFRREISWIKKVFARPKKNLSPVRRRGRLLE